MTTSVISSLYRPKGAKYECELCGKEAKIRCNECPTYYCCPEHFDHDWRGIRELIAKDTTLLRERTQALGSVEERERGEAELLNIKEEVRHICSETAKGFLIRDECFLAIPGALQALKLTTELFGATSTELVDSYLLLAECNLGIGKLNVAEEFLGLAKWIILKNPDAGNRPVLISALHRNFGRLYVAQGKHVEALRSFAEDTYQTSSCFGPEDTRTAVAYFHMGKVFQITGERTKADSFFTTVISIYARWFEKHIDSDGWLPEIFRRPGGFYRTPGIDSHPTAFEWSVMTAREGADIGGKGMDVERSQQNMMTNGRGQDGIFLTLTQRQETIDYLKYILKYREGKVNGGDDGGGR